MSAEPPYTVTLRLGQLSPKVPPCSLKVMRFHTAIMVSSGTLKWNSSTLAKDLNALSLRGVRVKYSVTKRQSVENRGGKIDPLDVERKYRRGHWRSCREGLAFGEAAR